MSMNLLSTSRYTRYLSLAVGFVLPFSVGFQANAEDRAWTAAFAPLPATADTPSNPITPQKVALGKKLFVDKRLSKMKDLSCNSCHGLDTFGVDNKPTSEGHKGQKGNRNSPTVYNAALHATQFWDGRAATVEDQALGPILNPVEMAMGSDKEVVERLRADKALTKEFAAAFPEDKDPVTYKNVGKAIGAFERTLLTPSRFDVYLKGDDNALTQAEKDGGKLFVQTGCTACHNGVAVGGQMFQKLGLVKPYDTKDLGRYEVTKNAGDKFFFKVPSLRNVDKTAPYFHDGSVATLEDAVSRMAEYQLGRNLSKQDVESIVTFLKSLTAEPAPKS
jgi:cytochrome c peroxidase